MVWPLYATRRGEYTVSLQGAVFPLCTPSARKQTAPAVGPAVWGSASRARRVLRSEHVVKSPKLVPMAYPSAMCEARRDILASPGDRICTGCGAMQALFRGHVARRM